MKIVEDVSSKFTYFGFLHLTYITYDGFELAKIKHITLSYRERQPLVFIYFDRLDFHYKIDQSTSESSAFTR